MVHIVIGLAIVCGIVAGLLQVIGIAFHKQ